MDFQKISAIARRFNVTSSVIYSWIDRGLIPEAAIDRSGVMRLVDADVIQQLHRDRILPGHPGRKSRDAGLEPGGSFPGIARLHAASHTTVGKRHQVDHRRATQFWRANVAVIQKYQGETHA